MYALATEVGEEQRLDARFVNENQRFKSRHPMYLRRASYGSLLLWLLVFLFSPVYHPHPYSISQDAIEVLAIAEDLVVPPPSREIPRPRIPVDLAIVPELEFEQEFVETLPPDWRALLPPAPPGRSLAEANFVAFDTVPEIVRWVAPEYPEMARGMELQGQVLVKVLVGTDGRPWATELVQGVHPILDREALEAAKRCVFSPGKQRDRPVEVWVTLPYTFRLF